VVEIIEEAFDAVTLKLRLPGASGFLAGQYCTVRWPVPGRERRVQRAYSVGSSPAPAPRSSISGCARSPTDWSHRRGAEPGLSPENVRSEKYD